jgi:hypothetical protein
MSHSLAGGCHCGADLALGDPRPLAKMNVLKGREPLRRRQRRCTNADHAQCSRGFTSHYRLLRERSHSQSTGT